MTRTSPPGKNEQGYILIDALVALFLLLAAAATLAGAVWATSQASRRQHEKVMTEIQRSNDHAASRNARTIIE